MRRAAILVVAVGLVAAACGREPAQTGGPGPQPTSSPDAPAEPPPALPEAKCGGRGGGSASNVPDFESVAVESKGGVERVTFRFRPRDPSVTRPPSHFVRFVGGLNTDAEGVPANLEGKAFVLVVFSAFGVDLSGEEPVQIYTGPTELKPGLTTIREVEQLGDFEATISWGIGLSRRACFVVEARADRLVLEFPTT
ncbi:MAG: AMIN-like domain-containing (lipo)protein [Actinomycetota bacterium]